MTLELERTDFTKTLVEQLPDLSLTAIRARGGRQHVTHRQHVLIDLLVTARKGERQHKSDPTALYFSSRDIRERLRTRNYHDLVAPFFNVDRTNGGYSSTRQTTKIWRLNASTKQAIDRALIADIPQAIWEVRDGTRVRRVTLRDLPTNGMPNEVRRQALLSVPSVFPVSVEQVDRAITRVKGWIDELNGDDGYPLQPGHRKTLGSALVDLYEVRAWSNALGGVPNMYKLGANGRLFPTTRMHLVSMSQPLRRLLLEDAGLFDHDLKSCHWAVYLALCERESIATDAVREYLATKQYCHQRWSESTGIPPSDLKAHALSLLTGSSLWAVGDPDARRRLLQDELLSAMRAEVKAAMAHHVAGEGPVNAVGAFLDPSTSTAAQKRSHLLTGYEQFAVQTMLERLRGVRAVLFDGWIAPRTDPGPLVEAVRERAQAIFRLDLKMELEVSDLSTPPPNFGRDPADF